MTNESLIRRALEVSRAEKRAASNNNDEPVRKNKPRTCTHYKSTECKGRLAVKS